MPRTVEFSPAADTTMFPRSTVSMEAPACSNFGVRVEVFSSIAAARADWQRLTDDDAIASPFGQIDWIEAWLRHVGEPAGYRAAIVVVRDRNEVPQLLLPLCLRRRFGVTRAEFFGESHSSLNFGLWRRDAIDSFTADRVEYVVARAAEIAGIDLLALRNQPGDWDGHANPLLHLPHQRCADDIYRLDIDGRSGDEIIKSCISGATRGTLRSKERKLAVLDGYRYFRAETQAEVDRILEAFFAQKAARLAEQGIANVFAQPGVETFLRATCRLGLAEGRPLMELHAIEGGGEILSMIGGLANGSRFTTMINSYTLSEHGRFSPGLIIITHAIRHFADRRLGVFDLGVGYAPYKTFFCKTVEELHDSLVPTTARGHAAALVIGKLLATKRWIKSTPAVWNVVQKLRRLRA